MVVAVDRGRSPLASVRAQHGRKTYERTLPRFVLDYSCCAPPRSYMYYDDEKFVFHLDVDNLEDGVDIVFPLPGDEEDDYDYCRAY